MITFVCERNLLCIFRQNCSADDSGMSTNSTLLSLLISLGILVELFEFIVRKNNNELKLKLYSTAPPFGPQTVK